MTNEQLMTADEIRYLAKASKTWEKAYALLLKNKKAMAIRLKELETWDKRSDTELERRAKIIALNNLLSK